jgi:hypothetical protein
MNNNIVLQFNHPIKELIWAISPWFNSVNPEVHERNRLRQERLRRSFELKKQMQKIIKKISKERKIYRKNNTNVNLVNMNKYEHEYKQMYNEYWYECVYKNSVFA